ncbi:hypothetical protein Tco_0517177 [Tanacetum coccineum]
MSVIPHTSTASSLYGATKHMAACGQAKGEGKSQLKLINNNENSDQENEGRDQNVKVQQCVSSASVDSKSVSFIVAVLGDV